jgi:energy-coupling factor transport system ATP-binding protein
LTALLQGWRAEGMAILVVTHDVEFAAGLADRVVIMDDGCIVASGSPAEVFISSPLFTPQIARVFPGAGWLTLEQALAGLGVHQKGGEPA